MVDMHNKSQDNKETTYLMGLEVCWIITNIACGPEDITKELFYQLQDGSDQLPVVEFISRFLTSNNVA